MTERGAEPAGGGPVRAPVIVLTFALDFPAPARMPRELHRAGFEVIMLAPRDALCTRSRFIDRVICMPDKQGLSDWIEALDELVQATQARLLLPGDDVALQVLMQIALENLPALRPGLQERLAALIRRSLGDPAHYLDSIDKGRLARRAAALGLPVPPGESVADAAAAVRAADALGYPVIVRPAVGWASKGVRVCAHATEVRAAMAELPRLAAFVPASAQPALVQRFIRGQSVNRAALAWEGREVAGFSRLRLRPPPEDLGAGSVSRYVALPEIAASNRRLVAALGASGFVATQYLLDAQTGHAYLIEINRRMVPATHTGGQVGVDLAAALAAALEGREWCGPCDLPEENERALALFPQEWLRDPCSPDLQRLATDAPWDDPELFRAMLNLGRGA